MPAGGGAAVAKRALAAAAKQRADKQDRLSPNPVSVKRAPRSNGVERVAPMEASESVQKVSTISQVTSRSVTFQVLDSAMAMNYTFKDKMKAFYKHSYTEIFVASLIVSNFACNILEKTIDPDANNRTHDLLWEVMEAFYNVAFTIELAINLYAFWFWDFWRSGWNVFDFVVVSIGVMTMLKVPLPGPLKLLRMMRAFRVFRLFKRVKSLRKIMEALARAIPGVINAFIILVIVLSIYAMLGVEFFRTFGEGGFFINERGHKVEWMTSRGQDYGWEYFGNFPKAIYTMFQVLTGESWSEVIARPLIHGEDTVQCVAFAFFFVSFFVLCGIILINVVVAVLLEKMVEPPEETEVDRDEGGGEADEDLDEFDELDPDQALRNSARDLSDAKQDAAVMKEQLAQILALLQLPSADPVSVAPRLFCPPHEPLAPTLVVQDVLASGAPSLASPMGESPRLRIHMSQISSPFTPCDTMT